MNYFLAPRSGETSYKNFQSTIKHGVPLPRIAPFLTSEEIEILSQEEIIYAWANRKGTKSAWDLMEQGDLVIFCSKGRLIMTGEVYFKKHSPELALAMWPPDEKGDPWEYTFFMRNIRYISMPLRIFNPIVGYKLNYPIQGFTHLKLERVDRVVKEYGSVEKMFAFFVDENSAEIPLENERVYVNISQEQEPRIINDAPLRPRQPGEYSINPSKRKVKIDHLLRNRNNSILGSKGEVLVLESERQRLIAAGHSDLAAKVARVSVEDDALGYDILSYEIDGAERYIEVKTSGGTGKAVRFFVSVNEYRIGKEKGNYYIYFVEKTGTKQPHITIIKNPIDEKRFLIKPDGYIFEAER